MKTKCYSDTESGLILNGHTFKLPNNISLMMVLASFFFFFKGLLFLKKSKRKRHHFRRDFVV